MLKNFFDLDGNKEIFSNLKISEEISLCEEYMGKFPVVLVSLKGINAGTYEKALDMAVQIIRGEARRFQYLLDSEQLTPYDKEAFAALLQADMSEVGFPTKFDYISLSSQCQSIFTGLNNLKVLSVADVQFDEYFGFTDSEVREMLEYYGLLGHYKEIKEWYNGYQFGNAEVYCPWDVINYCDALRADPDAQPRNYWSNTSINEAVRRFVLESDKAVLRRELEQLVAGEIITKEIHQELTYHDMYASIDNLWSVLFTTGYLTQRGNRSVWKSDWQNI